MILKSLKLIVKIIKIFYKNSNICFIFSNQNTYELSYVKYNRTFYQKNRDRLRLSKFV